MSKQNQSYTWPIFAGISVAILVALVGAYFIPLVPGRIVSSFLRLAMIALACGTAFGLLLWLILDARRS